MFVAKERITVNGRLAAFAGEAMTDEEAEARGITEHLAAGEKAPKAKKKADYEAEAAELGIDLPKAATVDQIKRLIEERRATADADGGDQAAGDGADGQDGGIEDEG